MTDNRTGNYDARATIYEPGEDRMTLSERLKFISLHGSITHVIRLESGKALIGWRYEANRIINRLNHIRTVSC